jgi:hypothetical protein
MQMKGSAVELHKLNTAVLSIGINFANGFDIYFLMIPVNARLKTGPL